MGEFDNLHQILLSLYEEMMPLCSDMAGVAKVSWSSSSGRRAGAW